MRWRQVVLLYGVCGLLAADYLLSERGAPVEDEETARQRPSFLDVQEDDVRELRIERGGRRLVARREDGVWEVTEPPGVGIRGDLVRAFARALTGAEEIDRVDAGRGDPAAMGFDESRSRVALVLGGGGTLHVVLGGPNPPGTAIYARREGAPSAVVIGRDVRYYEDMLFQALPSAAPEIPEGTPVGGVRLRALTSG